MNNPRGFGPYFSDRRLEMIPRYVVLNEKVLGLIYLDRPTVFHILRMFEDLSWRTLIYLTDLDVVRDATQEDFDHYRVKTPPEWRAK
jgi:hypothetical protein